VLDDAFNGSGTYSVLCVAMGTFLMLQATIINSSSIVSTSAKNPTA